MKQVIDKKNIGESSLSEKRKYTRKLKFFRGESVFKGQSIDICVVATSLDQCVDLCLSSGLTDTTKKRIKENWSIFNGSEAILEAESLPPLVEAGVWHLPRSSFKENDSQKKNNISPSEGLPPLDKVHSLGNGSSMSNWPFPVVYFDKSIAK